MFNPTGRCIAKTKVKGKIVVLRTMSESDWKGKGDYAMNLYQGYKEGKKSKKKKKKKKKSKKKKNRS